MNGGLGYNGSVSITSRIIDSARESFNVIMQRIAADDTPLSYVDEADLEHELAARRAANADSKRKPRDNPRARLAGADSAMRDKRAELSDKRAARVEAARDKRARAARAAEEELFRKARAEAERAAASASANRRSSSGASSSSSSTGSSSDGRTRGKRSGFPFMGQDDKLVEYYKVLDLPYGAEFSEVKAAYRKLMRKYHPDRHMGNPKKQKAATELTMRVTQAYNALEEHHKK